MKKVIAFIASFFFGAAFLGIQGGTAQTGAEQPKVKKVEQDKKIDAKKININKERKVIKRQGKAPIA